MKYNSTFCLETPSTETLILALTPDSYKSENQMIKYSSDGDKLIVEIKADNIRNFEKAVKYVLMKVKLSIDTFGLIESEL